MPVEPAPGRNPGAADGTGQHFPAAGVRGSHRSGLGGERVEGLGFMVQGLGFRLSFLEPFKDTFHEASKPKTFNPNYSLKPYA